MAFPASSAAKSIIDERAAVSTMTPQDELTPEAFVKLLHQFALDLLQRSTLDEIFWLIADRVIAGIGFDDCVIYLLDHEKKILIQKAAYGPKNPEGRTIKDAITIPVGEGIVGSVALNAKPERIARCLVLRFLIGVFDMNTAPPMSPPISRSSTGSTK